MFLGLPAAVLAALLTATVVTAGADRRRRDQALLRARGASQPQLIRLAAAEALVVGTIGSAVGLGAACLVGLAAFGSPSLGADPRHRHRVGGRLSRRRTGGRGRHGARTGVA